MCIRDSPLTSGDVLTTGPGSQAEIQIGSMTVRLDSDTTLDFSRIDDEPVSYTHLDVYKRQGLPCPVEVLVMRMAQGQATMDGPLVRLRLLQGRLRKLLRI